MILLALTLMVEQHFHLTEIQEVLFILHSKTKGTNWPQSEIISLLMHEMGHTLGFAHADYKTRRSCIPFGLQNAGDFSDSEVIGIPGTDASGDYTNSIMGVCDFTAEDKKSFRTVFK